MAQACFHFRFIGTCEVAIFRRFNTLLHLLPGEKRRLGEFRACREERKSNSRKTMKNARQRVMIATA
jgi:hypothetical protein